MSPSTRRLRALLSAGWSIWAPRRAGSAWLCPPAGNDQPCSRVRLATLDRAVGEGILTTERNDNSTSNDTFWTLA